MASGLRPPLIFCPVTEPFLHLWTILVVPTRLMVQTILVVQTRLVVPTRLSCFCSPPDLVQSLDCYQHANIRPPYTYAYMIRWVRLQTFCLSTFQPVVLVCYGAMVANGDGARD